jgi:hypothetical protein
MVWRIRGESSGPASKIKSALALDAIPARATMPSKYLIILAIKTPKAAGNPLRLSS